jgi:hypothetical protein
MQAVGKEEKKLPETKAIVAIVTRRSRWFGLVVDTKIYYDTSGHYSHPREAPSVSQWKITDFGSGTQPRFFAS